MLPTPEITTEYHAIGMEATPITRWKKLATTLMIGSCDMVRHLEHNLRRNHLCRSRGPCSSTTATPRRSSGTMALTPSKYSALATTWRSSPSMSTMELPDATQRESSAPFALHCCCGRHLCRSDCGRLLHKPGWCRRVCRLGGGPKLLHDEQELRSGWQPAWVLRWTLRRRADQLLALCGRRGHHRQCDLGRFSGGAAPPHSRRRLALTGGEARRRGEWRLRRGRRRRSGAHHGVAAAALGCAAAGWRRARWAPI